MVGSRTDRPAARPAAGGLPSFACESLEPRRLFAAGDLDASFGGDGDTTAAAPGVRLTGRDVAVQADGKTVVAGYAGSADRIAVTRYNLNGTPDTTFGPDHNGTVVSGFGNSSASAVAVQPDGKIVVLGTSDVTDTRVVRYNPDGALDRTFGGGDGTVVFDPVGLTEIATLSEVIVLPDGKILLGGDALTGVTGEDFDFMFVRLNADGSFDDSFDGDGKKALGFGINERFGGMAIDHSGTPATNPHYGSIVVAGYRYGAEFSASLIVTRLTPDGAHDTTYDGDGSGIVRYPTDRHTVPVGVVVQDDGRIVVGGYVDNVIYFLARFERNGPLDTTFGPNGTGWAGINMGSGADIATDVMKAPSGGLIVAGYTEVAVLGGREKRDAIAYYTADGRPDTRFGGDGTIVYPSGGGVALAAGPGRRIVFAGGDGMRAARFFDAGANLVYAATLNSVASESGPTARGFFVYRLERLPVPTRVYFSVGGTAGSPANPRGSDYSTEGLVFPISFPGFPGGPPYVEIPANATFAVATVTPTDDDRAEGNETAVFTIRPDAGYEVGDPAGVTLVIVDNDAPPPGVAQVFARGSSWRGTDGDALNVTFKEHLAAAAVGNAEFGYRVDNLPAGSTLPWINVNELVVRYSAPPTGAGVPQQGAAALKGLYGDYAVTAVTQIDPQTFALRLDRALGVVPAAAGGGQNGDRVTLTLPGAAAGGGSYSLTLGVLQGDANRQGGAVNSFGDLAFARARLNRTATDPGTSGATYTPWADVNGDGQINSFGDLAAVRARLNDALPAAPAAAAGSAFASGTPIALAPPRRRSWLAQPADVLPF